MNTRLDNESGSELPIIKYEELCSMDIPPINYLVDELIPEIGLTMFQGHPGAFKTWFAYYMAYCVANGLPLLDRFKTKKSKVLLVCPDDYLPIMRDRLNKAGFTKNIEVRVWDPEKIVAIEDDRTLEHLLVYIQEEKIGLVVIDTLRNIHGADENNSTEMACIMQRLSSLARTCCVVLLHHLSKNQITSAVVASRGSTVIPAALIAGFNFRYDKTNNCIRLGQFKNKIGRVVQEMGLKFNAELDGPNLFGLDVSSPKIDITEEIIGLIKDAYSDDPEPELTKDEFTSSLHERTQNHYSKNAITKAFNRLTKIGYLRKDGILRQANRACYIKNPDYEEMDQTETT